MDEKMPYNETQEKDTFSCGQKGFSFTLEPCNENTIMMLGRPTRENHVHNGYLITGYLLDKNKNRYYIECYEYTPEDRMNCLIFNAIVIREGGYDALIEYLSKAVSDIINDTYR